MSETHEISGKTPETPGLNTWAQRRYPQDMGILSYHLRLKMTTLEQLMCDEKAHEDYLREAKAVA